MIKSTLFIRKKEQTKILEKNKEGLIGDLVHLGVVRSNDETNNLKKLKSY